MEMFPHFQRRIKKFALHFGKLFCPEETIIFPLIYVYPKVEEFIKGLDLFSVPDFLCDSFQHLFHSLYSGHINGVLVFGISGEEYCEVVTTPHNQLDLFPVFSHRGYMEDLAYGIVKSAEQVVEDVQKRFRATLNE